MRQRKAKKVFILKNNVYTEITYQELWKLLDTDPEYENKHFIRLHAMVLEVSEKEYKDFYKNARRQRYLTEEAISNRTISINVPLRNEDDSEEMPEDIIADQAQGVEEQAEMMILSDKIHAAISLLSKGEQKLIQEIFFDEMTERDLAEIYEVSQVAIHKRKKRILKKLKKILE